MTILIYDKKVQEIITSIDVLADTLGDFRPSAQDMHITKAQYKLFKKEAARNKEFKQLFCGGTYRGYNMRVV